MKFSHGISLGCLASTGTLFLVGALALAPACVTLEKPPEVAACASQGTCADDVQENKDAAADRAPGPDTRPADEPVGNGGDVAPDSSSLAGGDLGKQDSAAVSSPDLPDEVSPADLAFADLPADGMASSDDGPRPGPDLRSDDVARDGVTNGDLAGNDVPEDGAPPDGILVEDTVKADLANPDLPADGSSDLSAGSECTIFYGAHPPNAKQGQPPAPNSKEGFCVATCDDIVGWGCSNFDGRTVTVNGSPADCGTTKLTKKDGYFVFRVSAGTNVSAVIYWWVNNPNTESNWAATCSAPAGGF
jgi:hypothetical protein